tara:strand:- start:37 stop:237 length:201 start_codon:yes stop_codon:yes gene_type:complete
MCLKIDTKYPKKNVAGKRNGDAIRVFLGYRFRKVSPINMAVQNKYILFPEKTMSITTKRRIKNMNL